MSRARGYCARPRRKPAYKTMVLASSSGTIAVSEDDQVLDETYPPPVEIISRWAYYASKYYQERTALENFDGDGRRLVIMNPIAVARAR